MKNIFYLFIIALLFTPACKDKNTTKNSYTLTGTLLKNCDGEPAANTELALQLESNEFLSVEWGGSTTRFKTDANGYFSVKYQTVSNSGISIVMFNNVGYTRILSAIPQNQNLDLSTIHLSKKYNLLIKLKVNDISQYNQNDTLFFRTSFGMPERRFLKYPFNDGIIDSLTTINPESIYNKLRKERIGWGFKATYLNNEKDYTISKICNGYNEVTIEI